LRQRALHAAQQRLAGRVQHDAPPTPLEQLEAEMLFQALDLLADRTVREVHHFRRGAQVLQLGNAAEGGKGVERQSGHGDYWSVQLTKWFEKIDSHPQTGWLTLPP